MKKLICAAVIALTITACDNRQAEVDQANRSRDSLASIINERDSSLNDFLTAFNEIEQNLDSVARKQNAINLNVEKQGELKKSAKDRINDNIIAINELMNENREKIAQLNRKLKSSGSKVAHFEKMLQTLNEQIAQKDRELADLNDKLNGLNTQVAQLQTSVDTLTSTTMAQSKTIEEQTTSLHTAYYVVGMTKELRDMKVIDKTGGLLGIGKTSKLSPNVDPNKFTRIDYVQVSTIPIDSKKAKVITSHPADSYSLNKEKDKVVSLQITNPEKFWSASKYLVVIKD
jgi:predicted  nucleic acid-binding Zn-ribbon protein